MDDVQTIDDIKSMPEFQGLPPVEKRKFVAMWIDKMPQAQGLPPEEKLKAINMVQSQFPDSKTSGGEIYGMGVSKSSPYQPEPTPVLNFQTLGIPSENQTGDPFVNAMSNPLAHGALSNLNKLYASDKTKSRQSLADQIAKLKGEQMAHGTAANILNPFLGREQFQTVGKTMAQNAMRSQGLTPQGDFSPFNLPEIKTGVETMMQGPSLIRDALLTASPKTASAADYLQGVIGGVRSPGGIVDNLSKIQNAKQTPADKAFREQLASKPFLARMQAAQEMGPAVFGPDRANNRIVEVMQGNLAQRFGSGAADSLADVATDPLTWVLGGGLLSGSKVLGRAFTAQMVYGAVQQIESLPNEADKANALGRLAVTVGMAGMGLAHEPIVKKAFEATPVGKYVGIVKNRKIQDAKDADDALRAAGLQALADYNQNFKRYQTEQPQSTPEPPEPVAGMEAVQKQKTNIKSPAPTSQGATEPVPEASAPAGEVQAPTRQRDPATGRYMKAEAPAEPVVPAPEPAPDTLVVNAKSLEAESAKPEPAKPSPLEEPLSAEEQAVIDRINQRRAQVEQIAPGASEPKSKVVSVTVDGNTRRVTLDPDRAKEWDSAEKDYNDSISMWDRAAKSGMDADTVARNKKAAGMEWAAKKREITGHYTGVEEANINKRLQTNYNGKPVIVDGEEGIVTGRSFGKVRVKFGDEIRSVNPEDIEAHPNAPTIKPKSPEYKATVKTMPKQGGSIDLGAATKTEAHTIYDETGKAYGSTDNPTQIENLRKAGFKVVPDKTISQKIVASLKDIEQSAQERLASRPGVKGRRAGSTLGPEDLKDLIIFGTARVGRGAVEFGQWSAEMVKHVGDWVKPHLKEVWEYVKPKEEPKAEPKEPAKASAGKKPPEPPKEPPKKTEGKAREPVPEGVTGVAKVITGREPQKGVSIEEMLDRGKAHVESKGENHLLNRAREVVEKGDTLSADELAAAGYHLRTLQNRRDATFEKIGATDDPMGLSALGIELARHDNETEQLLQASDITLNKDFHQKGMAAQIALHRDYSLQKLPQRAKAANLGEPPPPGMEAKIKEFQDKNSEINNKLKKATEGIGEELKKGLPPPTGSWDHPTVKKLVKMARQLFGLEGGETPIDIKKGDSERGALRYTLPTETMKQMRAFRTIARKVAFENPNLSFDQVIAEVRDRTGLTDKRNGQYVVPDERIYWALSEPYRKHLLESDINRLTADRYLRNLKYAAEYKLRSNVSKILQRAVDLGNFSQRTLQAGADISFQFIQGRKGIFANPAGWLRSWATSARSIIGSRKFVDRHMAEIEAHPQWPSAKAAGLQLRRMGDRFSPEQDEAFSGSIVHILSNLKIKPDSENAFRRTLQTLLIPVKAVGKGVGEVYERSEAAFVGAANDLTWSTYLKMAKAAPTNPAYLRDVASTINTIYGRGASKAAKAIGSIPQAGLVAYAPRYYISSLEYITGRPVLKAETGLGRAQALKIYAYQAATYGALVFLARANGWNVETDPRSSDFGKLEVPWPDGKKYKFDLFAKEAQAYRFVRQLINGKISQSGDYSAPSSDTAGRVFWGYVTGKIAPLPSTAMQMAFGKLDRKGAQFESRPYKKEDLLLDYLPLWIQQSLQDNLFKDAPILTLAQISGQDVAQGHLPKGRRPKMEWPKKMTNLKEFVK